MIDLFTADELDQLARRIAQIRPMSNSNPHAFYEERSEVASQIRALAQRLRARDQAQPAAADVPAPAGPFDTPLMRSYSRITASDGRDVQVTTIRRRDRAPEILFSDLGVR